LSFFDDGEETASRPSARATPPRPGAAGERARPHPRRPQHAGAAIDHQTLMRRRLVFGGAAVVLLIAIVLVINSCVKSEAQQSLKDYNRSVGELAQESNSQVAGPLFAALAGASGKSALDVEVQVDQLRIQAQGIAAKARSLSVPGEMVSAQRALLLALDLRAEGLAKVAALLPAALGSQNKEAIAKIAGDMEMFLASDVLFSQRVVPLVQQTLAGNGIHGLGTSASHFLPNLGWLEASTVQSRITGQPAAGTQGAVAPGTHGTALVSTSVGTTTLEPEPTINHISGGGNPTFSVGVEDTGSNNETNVKVDIAVTASGKVFKTSHAIDSIASGSKVSVEIPVNGIPLGVASKIEVSVEPVPGQTSTEGDKSTYLAVFGK
jgi:hypothetical protein